MPGALEAAGASPDGTKYAPLTMDRYFTGMATQRNPLRDADVPYLQAKFYGASRYDSIIDGLNTELTAELTVARRAGLMVYNSATFAQGYGAPYSFKWLLADVEQIQVFSANATEVDDITTSGSKINIWSKVAGARPTRYQGIGNTLYFADGKSPKKYLRSNQAWTANTAFALGSFIIDSNGNIQQVISNSNTLDITTIQVSHFVMGGITHYYLIVTFTAATPAYSLATWNATFSGVTSYTALDGQSLVPTSAQYLALHGIHPTADQLVFNFGTADYGGAADTGIAILSLPSSGTSGSTQPTWSTGLGEYTTDGGLTWRNYGVPTQNIQPAAPVDAPTATVIGNYWQPGTPYSGSYALLDGNGNYQLLQSSGTSGPSVPKWNTTLQGITVDGSASWLNIGVPGVWKPDFNYIFAGYISLGIIDPNGNLQYPTSWTGTPPYTGSTQPTWGTTPGATVTDGDYTWTCIGPGLAASTLPFSYAFSYHAIDGSVSTASPLITIPTAILTNSGSLDVILQGDGTIDPQVDQIWIWRTPQGESTLLYLDQTPNPRIGTAFPWSYSDFLPDSALNAFIAAPIANAADPPPSTVTAPVFYLGRLWFIDGATLRYSQAVNSVTGNALNQFAPLNSDTCSESMTRLWPITVNGGGLLVQSTSNLYIVMGSGTTNDPFLPMKLYMGGIGVRNYDAMCMIGSTLYAYTIQRKFISLDPSAGYVECGFFIGDQFEKMTTGGYDQVMFDPNYTSVVWHERNSGDSAIYIVDGSPTGGVGWFRYSPVATPESGFMWSPFAAITGGVSGVASIEVSPGDIEMVVMPGTAGPALKRDTSVNSDNGTTYVPYTTIGNIVLCPSGEIAEVAWVTLVSKAIGTQATVGLIFDEIAETTDVTFETLEVTSYDPPDLASIPSETLYSDRYVAMQNEECPKCVSVQMKVAWIAEDEANELLTHTIVGARYEERKQQ